MSNRQERRAAARARAKLAVHAVLSGKVKDDSCTCVILLGSPPNPGAPTKFAQVEALVDTGCTNTSIRADVAQAVGLPVIGKAQVSTASSNQSTVTCDVVMGVLSIPRSDKGTVSRPIPLTIAPMAEPMLLGMDALRGGVLTVDLVNGVWDWKLHQVGEAS